MISRFFLKVFITAVAALVASYLLAGVYINSLVTAFVVAIVLALLNNFIKPILIFLTLPITIVTLGLFLLVINILIIKWTASLVEGFAVDGWLSALLFSLIITVVTSALEGLTSADKKRK
jgi:putative membrane protein